VTGEAERPLPDDPDVEVDEDATGSALPVHLTPHLVLLVFAGGFLGVLLRAVISDRVAGGSAFPAPTFAINITGAFALSILIEALALRGSDVGRRRATRLFVGTGLLGGFTTYSAFALEIVLLGRNGHLGTAISYGLLSVVGGVLTAWLGIVAFSHVRHARTRA
jgi:CrcB protein